MASTSHINEGLLYQPDERPGHLASLLHGFQNVMGSIASMAATVSIVALAGGQTEDYLSWLYFTSLVTCGLGRIFQTTRFWRFGSGYSLSVSSASAFIAVCITTLSEGGPAMLSSLIAISAVIQFALITRLSLLRRIITPTVAGTVLMLMSATIISVVFGRLTDIPEGAPVIAAPILAGATLLVLVGMRLFASSRLQQWVPIIGISTGCAAAVAWGLYDFERVLEAPWVGFPANEWPGFDLSFNATFWSLLPGFVIVIMATTINSISGTVVIQQVAWRKPRATDFRVVQGAHNLLALTNLFAAAVGALPNMIGGANSARILLTGVAARRVGVYGGLILIAVAVLPKAIALAVAIPRPVLVAYMVFMLSLLFVQGMSIVVRDGIDGRKSAIVGLSLWLGVGFQNQLIFPELLTGNLETLLSNGMTTGSVCVIVLTALTELTSYRGKRLNVNMSMSALTPLDDFLHNFATKSGWHDASAARLRSVGEETLSSLTSQSGEESEPDKRLIVRARRVGGSIEVEFMATSGGENLEDKLAYLSEQPELQDEEDISFRLLRHYASSVQHRKYHDIDIVTVLVDELRS